MRYWFRLLRLLLMRDCIILLLVFDTNSYYRMCILTHSFNSVSSTKICKIKSNDLFASMSSSSIQREDVYNHDRRGGRDTEGEGDDGGS